LGTGTSQGVPIIGCDCIVCSSKDSKDKRLRTSLMVTHQGKHIIIDVGPDFRQQMLRASVKMIEAIILTHQHNDHIIGIDDVRPFNFQGKKDMPVYSHSTVLKEVKNRFAYIFDEKPYPGAPRLKLRPIDGENLFTIEGIPFIPIKVMHGTMPVWGFRIRDFTYITDAKTIEPKEIEKIKNSSVLVLNALHQKPHHSHLNLEEALQLIEQIKPQRAFLTHLGHTMGKHEEIQAQLPDNVFLAYDGLQLAM